MGTGLELEDRATRFAQDAPDSVCSVLQIVRLIAQHRTASITGRVGTGSVSDLYILARILQQGNSPDLAFTSGLIAIHSDQLNVHGSGEPCTCEGPSCVETHSADIERIGSLPLNLSYISPFSPRAVLTFADRSEVLEYR